MNGLKKIGCALVAATFLTGVGLAGTTSPAAAVGPPETANGLDGSRMTFHNDTDQPIRIATSPDAYANPHAGADQASTLLPRGSNKFCIQGYNQYRAPEFGQGGGPASGLTDEGETWAWLKDNRDAAAYLGAGYWFGAHNRVFGTSDVVAARFDAGKTETYDYARERHSGVYQAKVGDMRITWNYSGNHDDYECWEIRIKQFPPTDANPRLPEGSALKPGEKLSSANGKHSLNFQHDRNLVLYKDGKPTWHSGVVLDAERALMRDDGQLVIRDWRKGTEWTSRTQAARATERAPLRLQVTDDGKVQIIGTRTGTVYWENGRLTG